MMHEELERAIRLLEGKLPELRRLISESELTFQMSPEAEAMGERLRDALAIADDAASALRRVLLGGTIDPDDETTEGEPTPADDEPVDTSLAPTDDGAKETSASTNPNEPTLLSGSGERDIPGLVGELFLPFETDLWVRFPDREPIRPGWDVRRLFAVTNTEVGQFWLVVDERASAFSTEAPVEKEKRQEWLDTRIAVLEFDSEASRAVYLSGIVDAAREERDRKQSERRSKQLPISESRVTDEAFSVWKSPQTFAELRERYRDGLTAAVSYFLEDANETAFVIRQTLEQAERVWKAADGEISGLELLARTAKFQIDLLVPRPADGPQRWVPTETQIFKQLEAYRTERILASLDAKIAAAQAEVREAGEDWSKEVVQLRSIRDEIITRFYNTKLRLDDGEAGGAVGVPVTAPPPMRGPGDGRTFEEALAAPCNP